MILSHKFLWPQLDFLFLLFLSQFFYYSLLCCTQILVNQSLKSESLSAFLVVEVFLGYRYLAVAMDVEQFD